MVCVIVLSVVYICMWMVYMHVSVEPDEYGGHVVAAQPLRGIPGQQLREQFLQYILVGAILCDVLPDYIYEALTILYIFFPNAITTHDYELVLPLRPLELPHVRPACDHLLVVLQLRVRFVVKVTEGTRQV